MNSLRRKIHLRISQAVDLASRTGLMATWLLAHWYRLHLVTILDPALLRSVLVGSHKNCSYESVLSNEIT